MAYIGVFGAAVVQGSEVEIPTLAETRAQFDEWLLDEDEVEVASDNAVMLRALGLRG